MNTYNVSIEELPAPPGAQFVGNHWHFMYFEFGKLRAVIPATAPPQKPKSILCIYVSCKISTVFSGLLFSGGRGFFLVFSAAG